MITVEEVKARFPNPTVWANESPPDFYSVDGAFVMFVKDLRLEDASEDDRFPDEEEVAKTLESVNPAWGGDNSGLTSDIAFRLTTLNDEGYFEKAWQLLGRMLAWNGDDPSYLDI